MEPSAFQVAGWFAALSCLKLSLALTEPEIEVYTLGSKHREKKRHKKAKMAILTPKCKAPNLHSLKYLNTQKTINKDDSHLQSQQGRHWPGRRSEQHDSQTCLNCYRTELGKHLKGRPKQEQNTRKFITVSK